MRDLNPPITVFAGYYNFLSNFYPCQVTVEGVEYLSSEAAFQAMKSLDPKIRSRFVGITAKQAKGQGRCILLRQDWEQVKDDVMRQVLAAKFDQNIHLKNLLIETYPRHLEEGNVWGDVYWGTVGGKGQNKLGEMLMELRESYIRAGA